MASFMRVCTVPRTSVCYTTVFADNTQVILLAKLISFGIFASTSEICFETSILLSVIKTCTCFQVAYTELFEMIVGVLTPCHTKYN